MILEVCVDSTESAVNACAAGADRLELCSSLVSDGLTPSIGLLRVVKELVSCPVFCMVRPRDGDFLYTDDEMRVVRHDITSLRENGADGVVLGLLDRHGDVDEVRCAELVSLAKPLPVTFHRAFDVSDAGKWEENVSRICSSGCTRLLTSGQQPSVVEGVGRVREIRDKFDTRLVVVVGGGVRVDNVCEVQRATGVTEVHCSGRVDRSSEMIYTKSNIISCSRRVTSEQIIRDMKHTLNRL